MHSGNTQHTYTTKEANHHGRSCTHVMMAKLLMYKAVTTRYVPAKPTLSVSSPSAGVAREAKEYTKLK